MWARSMRPAEDEEEAAAVTLWDETEGFALLVKEMKPLGGVLMAMGRMDGEGVLLAAGGGTEEGGSLTEGPRMGRGRGRGGWTLRTVRHEYCE